MQAMLAFQSAERHLTSYLFPSNFLQPSRNAHACLLLLTVWICFSFDFRRIREHPHRRTHFHPIILEYEILQPITDQREEVDAMLKQTSTIANVKTSEKKKKRPERSH